MPPAVAPLPSSDDEPSPNADTLDRVSAQRAAPPPPKEAPEERPSGQTPPPERPTGQPSAPEPTPMDSGLPGVDFVAMGKESAPDPIVNNDDEFNQVEPGKFFIGPDGQRRQKLWQVVDDASFKAVPDGAQFIDPEGQTRWKAKYEAPDVVTQTLFDMASDPQTQFNVLARGYGADKVQTDPNGGFMVDLGKGRRVKPGTGHSASDLAARAVASIGASAAPTLGVLGGTIIGGGGTGVLTGGAGAVGGGIVGAGVGGAAGKAFNQLMLQLAGVQAETGTQQVAEQVKEGEMGALFQTAGAALPAIGGAVKSGLDSLLPEGGLSGLVRKTGRYLTGMKDEQLKNVQDLAATEGGRIPVKSWGPEAPFLSKITDAAKVYGFDPVEKFAKTHYETRAGDILSSLGVPEGEVGSLTEATAAPSAAPLGEKLTAAAQAETHAADAELESKVSDAWRTATDTGQKNQRGWEQKWAQDMTNAQDSLDKNQTAVQGIIDSGWQTIKDQMDKLRVAIKSGAPGDVAREVGERIQWWRRSIGARAEKYYQQVDRAAGNATIDISQTKEAASGFLDNLPEELQKNHPQLVKALNDLDSGSMTFGQAHYLRSMLRDLPNWYDLEPSLKNGLYKHLANSLNADMHAASDNPQLAKAMDMLDTTDSWYANQMGRFKSERIQQLVTNIKDGLPPDPETIAKQILVPGETETINQVKNLVGLDAWDRVIHADMNSMLNQSKTLGRQEGEHLVDGNKLWQQIEDRVQSGILDHYPPKVKEALLQHAENLKALNGKLDVAIPANADFGQALQAVNTAKAQLDVLAKEKPIDFMEQALSQAKSAEQALRADAKDARAGDQLRFLTQPDAKVEASAEKILGDKDLIKEVFRRYGDDSDMVGSLRQTAARMLLTRDINSTAKIGSELSNPKGIFTQEIQDLLFPGDTGKSLQTLSKNMEVLFPGGGQDLHSNLMGGAWVTNPAGAARTIGGKSLGGVATALPKVLARAGVSKMLEFLSDKLTGPIPRWLAQETQRGTPEALGRIQTVMDLDAAGRDYTSALPTAVAAAITAWRNSGEGETRNPTQPPAAAPESWRPSAQQASATPGTPASAGVDWRSAIKR